MFSGMIPLTTSTSHTDTRRNSVNAILRAAVVEMGGGGEGGIPDPIVDLLSTNSDVGGN